MHCKQPVNDGKLKPRHSGYDKPHIRLCRMVDAHRLSLSCRPVPRQVAGTKAAACVHATLSINKHQQHSTVRITVQISFDGEADLLRMDIINVKATALTC